MAVGRPVLRCWDIWDICQMGPQGGQRHGTLTGEHALMGISSYLNPPVTELQPPGKLARGKKQSMNPYIQTAGTKRGRTGPSIGSTDSWRARVSASHYYTLWYYYY